MQRQFEYLCAQTQEWGAEHNLFRTASLSALYGDTSDTMVIVPLSAKRHASSPTRRTLSARSALEKPRSRLSPKGSYSKVIRSGLPGGIRARTCADVVAVESVYAFAVLQHQLLLWRARRSSYGRRSIYFTETCMHIEMDSPPTVWRWCSCRCLTVQSSRASNPFGPMRRTASLVGDGILPSQRRYMSNNKAYKNVII